MLDRTTGWASTLLILSRETSWFWISGSLSEETRENNVRSCGRALLMLRSSPVRSYRVGHAKHSRKYFEDDATVEYPETIPDQRGHQREQSLHRGLLERQHNPGNPGDQSHKQVQRIQKFQDSCSGVRAEGKVQQAFQHSFGLGHPYFLTAD